MDNTTELTQEQLEMIMAFIQNYIQKVKELISKFMKSLNNFEETANG